MFQTDVVKHCQNLPTLLTLKSEMFVMRSSVVYDRIVNALNFVFWKMFTDFFDNTFTYFRRLTLLFVFWIFEQLFFHGHFKIKSYCPT